MSAWVSEMSVMSSDALLQADRERFTQLLFEQFNVAGLYLGEQGVLSLYSVGKTTGTVIDLGHGKTGDVHLSLCMAPPAELPGSRCCCSGQPLLSSMLGT